MATPTAITLNSPISALGLTTQAPRSLAEAGITTVGRLVARDREQIAALRGMGASRMTDVDDALARYGLTFGTRPPAATYGTCKLCPVCGDCGMPRAMEAKHVVVDYRGRAKHVTAPGDPCDYCDTHHRQLVANAAGAAVAA